VRSSKPVRTGGQLPRYLGDRRPVLTGLGCGGSFAAASCDSPRRKENESPNLL
jgi:hypothetical protein